MLDFKENTEEAHVIEADQSSLSLSLSFSSFLPLFLFQCVDRGCFSHIVPLVARRDRSDRGADGTLVFFRYRQGAKMGLVLGGWDVRDGAYFVIVDEAWPAAQTGIAGPAFEANYITNDCSARTLSRGRSLC